jgi:hypothetical protein
MGREIDTARSGYDPAGLEKERRAAATRPPAQRTPPRDARRADVPHRPGDARGR